MVKVQIGASTFFCDTAEEAVRVHRLAGAGPIPQASNGTIASHRIPAKNGHANGSGASFLKKLGPHVGKELSSDDMAKVAGAKSAVGLGPKMAQFRRTLADDGVALDDFVLRKKDTSGPVTWEVVKAGS